MNFSDNEKKKNIPTLKYAYHVIRIGIFVSILTFILSCLRIFLSNEYFFSFYILLPILSVFCFIIFLIAYKKFEDQSIINFSLFLTTCAIMIFGIEIYFEMKIPKHPYGIHKLREDKARELDVYYDSRTKFEVMLELRSNNQEIYPNIHPLNLIINENKKGSLKTRQNKLILPLGTISNVNTIFPNEAGYFPIIFTDEYGFNNPSGLYGKKSVDIILIGDSFAEGCSVSSDETIGAVLREEGYNTISFGKFGNDPMMEFATLREYGASLKPKIVLWCYYKNDLPSLEEYKSWKNSTVLGNYLYDDDFTQNLMIRQKEIDSLLLDYENFNWNNKKREYENLKISESKYFQRVFKLYNLRSKLGLTAEPRYQNKPQNMKENQISKETVAIFSDILIRANELVSQWNGTMFFINFPSYDEIKKNKNDKYYKIVNQVLNKINMPNINLKKVVFDKHPHPISLFPFGLPGHYNAEGYKFIGLAIAKKLKSERKSK